MSKPEGFNEHGYHIENLKIARAKLAEDKEQINLDMSTFSRGFAGHLPGDVDLDCGTPACIAGHLTRYFPFSEDELQETAFADACETFSERCFSLNEGESWDFLFGYYWPNDIEEAIARIDYVIEHGRYPENYTCLDGFAESTAHKGVVA